MPDYKYTDFESTEYKEALVQVLESQRPIPLRALVR